VDGLGEGRGVGSAGNCDFGAGLGLGMLRRDSLETRRMGVWTGMGKERTRGVAQRAPVGSSPSSSSSESESSSVLRERRVNISVSSVFMPEVVKDSARSRDKKEQKGRCSLCGD